MSTTDENLVVRLMNDLEDDYDEEFELEYEDRNVDRLSADRAVPRTEEQRADRRRYFRELFRLQAELVKLQDWVVATKHRVVIDEEQHLRFLARIHDPMKQWKLSPMDLESRRRWEAYTRAKEVMLQRTHIPEAPWWVVPAVDKKKARLNCIHHLLQQMPYEEIERPAIVLPPREHSADYMRQPVPQEVFVPEVY